MKVVIKASRKASVPKNTKSLKKNNITAPKKVAAGTKHVAPPPTIAGAKAV